MPKSAYAWIFCTVAFLLGAYLYLALTEAFSPHGPGGSLLAAAGCGLGLLVAVLGFHMLFRIALWKSELLLLQVLPAVWAGQCFQTFSQLEPKDHHNSGAFLLMGGMWLFNRTDLATALQARRVRTWGWAALFCLTLFFCGMLVVAWFPFSWSGLVIAAAGLVVIVGTVPDSATRPAGAAAGAAAAAPAPPEAATPARPLPLTAPRRRRLLAGFAVILLGFIAFGAVGFFFRGKSEPLASQRIRATLGSTDARLKLGWRYRTGDGVPQDFTRAARWFERAAKSGSARAQYDFGILLYYELGTREIYGLPNDYFGQAAQQDYAPAITMLGIIASRSELDTEKALALWQRAAALHDPFAEYLLGIGYLGLSAGPAGSGELLESERVAREENLIRALFWLEKSRRDGVELVGGMLQHVWATVPPESLAHVTAEVFRRLEESKS